MMCEARLGHTDEAALLWAAALVEGVDASVVADAVDVKTLTAIVADAEVATDAVEEAAVLLVGVVSRRPFPRSNAAIAWLAAMEALTGARCRIHADPARVVGLCAGIGTGEIDVHQAAASLRRWVVEDGAECPACGRRVFRLDAADRRGVMPGYGRFELTARCAYEHRAHDRAGRPLPATATAASSSCSPEARQPILARGDCGSFLVAGDGRALVLSPSASDPTIVLVVDVDGVLPGDLVGRWDDLVRRSPTVGFVATADLDLGHDDQLDLHRLHAALDAGRPARSMIGAGA